MPAIACLGPNKMRMNPLVKRYLNFFSVIGAVVLAPLDQFQLTYSGGFLLGVLFSTIGLYTLLYLHYDSVTKGTPKPHPLVNFIPIVLAAAAVGISYFVPTRFNYLGALLGLGIPPIALYISQRKAKKTEK